MSADSRPSFADSPGFRAEAACAASGRQESLQAFLKRCGLCVSSPDLIAQALTHRSYAFEHGGVADNERLEFLGDAVLGGLAAEFLYASFPDESEGELSKKRSFLVSRDELGRRAEALGMSSLILLGRGEESSGGSKRLSITGSALEAFVGALYLEIPLDVLKRFVRESILQPGIEAFEKETDRDFKSQLQELLQKQGRSLPIYKRACEEGPAHQKRFVVEVYIGEDLAGTGEGARVKTAENEAAREACRWLRDFRADGSSNCGAEG